MSQWPMGYPKNSMYGQLLLQIQCTKDDNHIDLPLNTLKISAWYKDSDNWCLLLISPVPYYVLTTCHLQISNWLGVEVNADI